MPAESTVAFNPAAGATVDIWTGGTTLAFYNFVLDNSGNTDLNTLRIQDTATIQVSNDLTLKGNSTNRLTVASDDGTNTVDLDLSAGGTQSLDYLTVTRVDSATGLEMIPDNTTAPDCTSTVNWTCGGAGTYVWDGSTSADWSNALNWDVGRVPDNAGVVTIPDVDTDPILGQTVTVASLTIQEGGILDLGGNDLSASSAFSNSGTLKLQGGETVSEPTNGNGSTVQYSTSGAVKDWTYHHLKIQGTGAYTLAAASEALAGNLNVTAGTLTTGNGKTIEVDGILYVDGGTLTGTAGTINADGDVSITSGTLTAPDGDRFTIAGNLSRADPGVFTANAGTT